MNLEPVFADLEFTDFFRRELVLRDIDFAFQHFLIAGEIIANHFEHQMGNSGVYRIQTNLINLLMHKLKRARPD